jgi:hypothetical protein
MVFTFAQTWHRCDPVQLATKPVKSHQASELANRHRTVEQETNRQHLPRASWRRATALAPAYHQDVILIQLLLPAQTADADTAASVSQTRDELTARFGGVTAYQQTPASGQWSDPRGGIVADQVVLVEVVAREWERDWWRQYADVLARRFHQDVIHVRALPIELLDPAAA